MDTPLQVSIAEVRLVDRPPAGDPATHEDGTVVYFVKTLADGHECHVYLNVSPADAQLPAEQLHRSLVDRATEATRISYPMQTFDQAPDGK